MPPNIANLVSRTADEAKTNVRYFAVGRPLNLFHFSPPSDFQHFFSVISGAGRLTRNLRVSCPSFYSEMVEILVRFEGKNRSGPVESTAKLFENFENFVVDRCLFLMTRSFISDRFIQKCWAGNPQKVRNYFPIRKRNCAIELKLKCRSMKSETRSRPVTFRLVSHFNFDEINKLIRRSQRDGRYAQNQFHAAVRARRSRGRRNLNFSDIF